MSEVGQKLTQGDESPMSALLLSADIVRLPRHVRFVPLPDSCAATKSGRFWIA
jgi:hypothetical protein